MSKPPGSPSHVPPGANEALRHTLEALPDKAGFLEGLFVHSPVPYAVFDASGRCLCVNPAYEAMFGSVPPPEYNLLEDELTAAAGLREYVRRAFAGERVRAPTLWYDPKELRHVRVKDARRVAIGCTFFPLWGAGGAVTHVAIAYQDVTAELEARERAEREHAAVVEREQRLLLLSDASGVLAEALAVPEAALHQLAVLLVGHLADWCVVDVMEEDGTCERVAVAHADPAQAPLAGQLRRVSTGAAAHPLHLPTRVMQGGSPLLVEEVEDALLQEWAVDEAHLETLRAMGLRSLIAVPLVARGRTLGVMTLGGVSGGVRLGPDHLSAAEDLAHRAALALDNARLYKEAQEAIRLRDEFLSVASHELKTPLTPLSLKLQSFARAARTLPDSAQRLVRDAEVMSQQVKRLSELVNDLLDVSRLTTGQLKLEFEPVDFSTLVHEVASRFEPEAERVGSALSVTAPEPVLGVGDRLRLDQVVSNLLSNALKYGAGKPVRVRVDSDGTHLRLRVEDEGIGIAPEALERIFGRFERAVSERHYRGLGLGLYVTRQIIERLGGRVGVVSQPGQGATFTVELPLHPPGV